MNALLVQPAFPLPRKSRYHRSFLPTGLLKLAALHRSAGDRVELVHGLRPAGRPPDIIYITSLFTYWSGFVHESVRYYRRAYPSARIVAGGIYASLMPEHCRDSGCDEVFVGVHKEAENYLPAYDLVCEVDFQVIHATRGCPRRCSFCGTWKIEPKFEYKRSIRDEIFRNNVVFYDNNLLASPAIRDILDELAGLRVNRKPVVCDSQCGFDGRYLDAEIAALLKKAHFVYPKIAWDGPLDEKDAVREWIGLLVGAGFPKKDVSVFMLYNHDLSYEVSEAKRKLCRRWGVQVADCRYRPLDQTYDNYDPRAWRKGQGPEDYYIHPHWTDRQIRLFRRNVRRHNICVRHGFSRYVKSLERLGKKRKDTNGAR